MIAQRETPDAQTLVAFVMAQSNFDRRRINGPEESFQPIFDPDEEDETGWKPGNPRIGRGARDIRPICAVSSSGPFTRLAYDHMRALSLESWLDQSGQRFCIHRDREDEDSLCSVSELCCLDLLW